MLKGIGGIEFLNLRSFRSAKIDLSSDMLFVGQNDHGKSSIFKLLDVLFNRLDKKFFMQENALPEEIFKIINPAFSIHNKARRLNLLLNREKLIITFKEANITVAYGKAKRGATSNKQALRHLFRIINNVTFVHIPSARDANSPEYIRLFQRMMEKKGLQEIIPKMVGGTRREYRLLAGIRKQLAGDITPFLDQHILPAIRKNLPLNLPYDLKIGFQVDMAKLIDWINQSLSLEAQIDSSGDATIPVTEVGSGVQSLLMLAIQRVLHLSVKHPKRTYILAIEEPEAYLHPQAQRNLIDDLYDKIMGRKNIRILLTTHSPYILNKFSLNKITLVRKEGKISSLYPPVVSPGDAGILNYFNDEINSEIFFARAVLFVEGEGDKRSFYKLLYNLKNVKRGDITIISAGGNSTFAPYLRLIKSLDKAKIPWGAVTDFDSLMNRNGQRPFLSGVRDAGIKIDRYAMRIRSIIDNVLDKDEADYIEAARQVSAIFRDNGLNVFVLPCDLEWMLCSEKLKGVIQKIIKSCFDIEIKGLTLPQLRKKIGSKGIPISSTSSGALKKPFLNEQIAGRISKDNANEIVLDVVDFISAMIG
ncbi:MAG: AAA family ATPase [Candidatus Omnitrophica bacterium]|nr:AAA family ATPase [Candidatus Omnitrophota bacterium]